MNPTHLCGSPTNWPARVDPEAITIDATGWILLSAVVAVVAAALTWARIAARRRLERLAAELPAALAAVESVASVLQAQTGASSYLVRATEQILRSKLVSLERDFLTGSHTRDAAKLPSEPAAIYQALRKRHTEVSRRLASYNAEYLRLERAEHEHLLRTAHELNDAQIEAVIKDDTRNLVIAGAGAGKTRVIIARMEYLTKRKAAVPPHRILAVTYTRQAASVIQRRLVDRGIKGTHASTLHALGKRIVGRTRGYDPNVIDEGRVDELIRSSVDAAKTGKDDSFAQLYLRVLSTYFRSEREDVPEQPPDQLYRSLKGKRVESFGERIIADYLFLHGIAYEHEEVAKWAPRTRGKGPYKPDFRLTEHGTYIEHWGVDEQGRVPAWFTWTSEQYQEKMQWARGVFAQSEYRLIETYDYERPRGDLEMLLAKRLAKAGIAGKSMGLAELATSVKDFNRIDRDLAKMFSAFITNARALRLRSSDIPARLKGHTPRVVAFGTCATELLRRYEKILEAEQAIDFSDMLYEAAEAIESGEMDSEFHFDQVLVDEFQDISPDKARLITALTKGGAKLFAVGDDYQGIFAFSGGDIGYIVDFEHHFGPATTTLLETNYRSPELIVEAGKAVIAHNPRQIKKVLRAARKDSADAVVHTVDPNIDAILQCTMEIITQEAKRVQSLHDLLVISRVNWPFDHLRVLLHRARIRAEGDDGIRLQSAHKSKGTEAEVVIIMDASEDRYGFPPQHEDSDVLEPVRLGGEEPLAEERRLFYVAVTRTMRRLHLVVRDGRRSRFIDEIEGESEGKRINTETLRAGERVSGTLRVERLYQLTPGQTRWRMFQAGVLNTGRESIKFASWQSKNPSQVEAGKQYHFADLLVTEYEGKPQFEIDGATQAVETVAAQAFDVSSDSRPLRVRRV